MNLKSALPYIPRLIRFTVIFTLINVALLSVLRLAFWLYFKNDNTALTGDVLSYAFYLGLKYDLRLTLYVLIPVFFLGWLRFLSPFKSQIHRYLWTAYLSIATSVIYFVYILNYGHYAYLHEPLNSTALRFLENLDISAQMVWESYPVIWISLGLILAICAFSLGLYRLFTMCSHRTVKKLSRLQKTLISTSAVFLFLFGMYGKLSWYPLRWSDAFFSTDNFSAAVAMNPVLYALETLKNRDVSFDEQEARRHYDQMVDYLGVDQPDRQALNYSRTIDAKDIASPRPNIVIVILESFAAYKSGSFGNPLDPTPHFDQLAKNGLLFENFFVPTTGTARSVFTTITGLPDIERVKTSTRNPLIVDQHTIISDFDGYEKLYFLGGSASWGNIRGLLKKNIPGLNIYEEGSYQSPRVDVWGISDLSLFKEANQVFSRPRDKPFIAIVQSSGGHRPYTIPDDNEGFISRDISDDEAHRYGFISAAEFNAYRFMDHSVGYFMREASKQTYFDNTIFAFYGDHGITGFAGEHSAKAESELLLSSHRVPFLIYSPKHIQPQRLDTVASEVDVLPTMAGLAGIGYKATTLGRDLFDERYHDKRFAFTFAHGNIPDMGLIHDDHYFIMDVNSNNRRLHIMDSDQPKTNLIAQLPDKAREMESLTRAIYESVKYIRYHNKD